MAGKERRLPRPPKTPFGKRRTGEREEESPLTADRMAAAMAEGRLDEFLKEEMPDNEYARGLAAMMMGMTGMMPEGAFPQSPAGAEQQASAKAGEPSGEASPPVQPPEDVIDAVNAGDLKGVMEALAREHRKRMPAEESLPAEEEKKSSAGLSKDEKETLDRLLEIAAENRVSVDWMVLRALKLYIREYRKTGRL
jgi:hypothetical protein